MHGSWEKNYNSVFWSLSLSISLFNIILYIHAEAILSQQSTSELINRAMDSSNLA